VHFSRACQGGGRIVRTSMSAAGDHLDGVEVNLAKESTTKSGLLSLFEVSSVVERCCRSRSCQILDCALNCFGLRCQDLQCHVRRAELLDHRHKFVCTAFVKLCQILSRCATSNKQDHCALCSLLNLCARKRRRRGPESAYPCGRISRPPAHIAPFSRHLRLIG
jgi:hypothetical protein